MVYALVALTGALAALRPGSAMTVGMLTAFLSYANQYTKPFNEISGVVTELQNAIACAARLFELIEAPAQTPDAPDAAPLAEVRGAVAWEHVDFSYSPDRPLIEDFNLSVKPGQRVAIVGPTGCGKTTLINLLMRFYDVDAGGISVDGREIRGIPRSSLRAAYGMVLQETWLKPGTIRENIAMGKPDATEEEIVAAAKAAHAHSFIRRLPEGYDTVIGEDGGQLSQGQKQLLCITRVMLCLPPMLILDEATSSIDTRTELRIQSAFARMMQGRTSFIVAHRLSTIREADVILVMRDGHIVEQGSHDELLKKNGFYAELYNSQFAGDGQPPLHLRAALGHGIAPVVGEAEVEHPLGDVEALLAGGRAQHHGDQAHVAALGGGADAVAGLLGGAGLAAVAAVVQPDELVGVHQLGHAPVAVVDVLHPDGGIIEVGGMGEHPARHDGHVAGGGVLALGGQAGAVDEVRVRHAQFAGAAVHGVGTERLAAVERLGQGHGGVVGAADDHAFQQRAHVLALTHVQQHLRAAHARRALRDRDRLFPARRARRPSAPASEGSSSPS